MVRFDSLLQQPPIPNPWCMDVESQALLCPLSEGTGAVHAWVRDPGIDHQSVMSWVGQLVLLDFVPLCYSGFAWVYKIDC